MKATNDEVSLWQQRIDAWRESDLKHTVHYEAVVFGSTDKFRSNNFHQIAF